MSAESDYQAAALRLSRSMAVATAGLRTGIAGTLAFTLPPLIDAATHLAELAKQVPATTRVDISDDPGLVAFLDQNDGERSNLTVPEHWTL